MLLFSRHENLLTVLLLQEAVSNCIEDSLYTVSVREFEGGKEVYVREGLDSLAVNVTGLISKTYYTVAVSAVNSDRLEGVTTTDWFTRISSKLEVVSHKYIVLCLVAVCHHYIFAISSNLIWVPQGNDTLHHHFMILN